MNASRSISEPQPRPTDERLSREQIRWLWKLTTLASRPLALAVGLPWISAGLIGCQAWLLAYVVELAIVQFKTLSALTQPIIGITLCMLIRAALTWAGERAGTQAAEKIKLYLRQTLFQRLMARSPYALRQQISGELASSLIEQIEAFEGFFARYLPAMGATFIPILFALVLLNYDLVVGLILLLTTPLIPFFMALIGWSAQAVSRRYFQTFARLTGFFADRVRGLATLKLYGRERTETNDVIAASHALRVKTMAVLRIAFLSSAVLEFFAALGVAGVAVYIGLSYLGYLNLRATPLSLQTGLFCLLMAPEVYAPLRQLAVHYHDRAAARAAVSEIAAVFGELPALQSESVLLPLSTIHSTPLPQQTDVQVRGARLIVQALTIQVPNRPSSILNQAAFSLVSGVHGVLIGPSGSGKSSLCEALCRLRPYEGHIGLDEIDLSIWDETALRSHVVWIGQSPFLFAGSIAANIRLGCLQASDQDVYQAAQRAFVMEFASLLPQGLDTVLNARGHGLSGGQVQRVALARLFLRNPALIILDEPTAHLDKSLQDQVLNALFEFAENRTLLVATHAIEVAQRFSIVLKIAENKVVQV